MVELSNVHAATDAIAALRLCRFDHFDRFFIDRDQFEPLHTVLKVKENRVRTPMLVVYSSFAGVFVHHPDKPIALELQPAAIVGSSRINNALIGFTHF
jgi:hypothetical protein